MRIKVHVSRDDHLSPILSGCLFLVVGLVLLMAFITHSGAFHVGMLVPVFLAFFLGISLIRVGVKILSRKKKAAQKAAEWEVKCGNRKIGARECYHLAIQALPSNNGMAQISKTQKRNLIANLPKDESLAVNLFEGHPSRDVLEFINQYNPYAAQRIAVRFVRNNLTK